MISQHKEVSSKYHICIETRKSTWCSVYYAIIGNSIVEGWLFIYYHYCTSSIQKIKKKKIIIFIKIIIYCIFALKLLLKKQCCAYILYQRRVKIVGKEGKRSKREENVINPKEGAKRRFGPHPPSPFDCGKR